MRAAEVHEVMAASGSAVIVDFSHPRPLHAAALAAGWGHETADPAALRAPELVQLLARGGLTVDEALDRARAALAGGSL